MSTKVFICSCKQCRHVKNKRSNRKVKRKIARLMNKRRRRNEEGKVFNWYWA